MKFAIIDTEGSGLFRYKDENGATIRSDAPGQPRLAAMSLIILDEELVVQKTYSVLIKPDGWAMSAEATAVNGLTDERLTAEGVPVREALDVYTQAVKDGFAMAAFNAQHDLRQIRGELRRAGMPDLFEETLNFCAMRKSMGVVKKLNGKGGWPGLKDACAHFGITNAAEHTSLGDAMACLEVMRWLKKIGRPIVPEVHFAKEKPEMTTGKSQIMGRVNSY